MNLKNNIIVITGGSKGLGKELAQAFRGEGAEVIINARSKKELQIASKETGAIPYVGDITKEKDVKKLAAFAVKKFGRIDVWVNNAGSVLPHSTIEDINP